MRRLIGIGSEQPPAIDPVLESYIHRRPGGLQHTVLCCVRWLGFGERATNLIAILVEHQDIRRERIFTCRATEATLLIADARQTMARFQDINFESANWFAIVIDRGI